MNLCICNWKRAGNLSFNIHATISAGAILPNTGLNNTARTLAAKPCSRIVSRAHS